MARSDSKQPMDLAWKATAALATLASGFLAEKVVALGWRALTGKEAPRDEDTLVDYQLLEVVAFAVISGTAITLARQAHPAPGRHVAREPPPHVRSGPQGPRVLIDLLAGSGHGRGQSSPWHGPDRRRWSLYDT